MQPEIDVLPSPAALATAVADRFVSVASGAIRARGEFIVALPGGSTPRATFTLLATPGYAGQVDWPRVHVVWSDERCVPPDDAASNYRMARETLLDHVPVPAVNIHRIRGEHDAARAAASYEQVVRTVLRTPSGAPTTSPGARIDLALLGLGEDGHTASLFPGKLPPDDARWAAAVPATPVARVTLTPPVINAAAEILFVVSGSTKGAIVRRVLNAPRDRPALPAQLINTVDGRVRWMLDAAAAAQLDGSARR
jgi:6-phosphogluconolactonase